MTDDLAVYDLNSYLWNVALLDRQADFTLPAGIALPFFPTQQTPESIAGPHFVYTTRTIPGIDLWQTSTDEILYRVYAPEQDIATSLSNVVVRNLRKFDESADAINNYLASISKNDFRFLYLQVLGNNSPNPLQSEDGLWGRPVWVRAHYVENEY